MVNLGVQQLASDKKKTLKRPEWSVARKPLTPSKGYVSRPLSPRIDELKKVLRMEDYRKYEKGVVKKLNSNEVGQPTK